MLEPDNQTVQERRPKFRRTTRPAMQITPRDLDMLTLVHEFSRCEAKHVISLTPGYRANLMARLRLLWDHGYVEKFSKGRPELTLLDNNRFTGGSKPDVYVLGAKGAELLSEARPEVLKDRPYDARILARRDLAHVAHGLEVVSFRVSLALACGLRPGYVLQEWRDERWMRRSFVAKHFYRRSGKKRTEPDFELVREEKRSFAPDGYARVVRPQGVLHVFVEIDRDRRELSEVCEQMLSYWLVGPKLHPGEEWVVIYSAPSAHRIQRLRETLATIQPRIDRVPGIQRFLFTTESSYSRPVVETTKTGSKRRSWLFDGEAFFAPVFASGYRTREQEEAGKPDRILGVF